VRLLSWYFFLSFDAVFYADNLVLHLHLRVSRSQDSRKDSIQIFLSEDATSELRKGMELPHIKLRKHYKRKPMEGEDPLQSAMRILRKQMELEANA
jgi:hypothetical protein